MKKWKKKAAPSFSGNFIQTFFFKEIINKVKNIVPGEKWHSAFNFLFMIVYVLTFKILINSCMSPFIYVLRWKPFSMSLATFFCSLFSPEPPILSADDQEIWGHKNLTFTTWFCSSQYLSLLIHFYSHFCPGSPTFRPA